MASIAELTPLTERPSFWLVILTTRNGGRQYQITPHPDNRKTARQIAKINREIGHAAYVVKRHEWEAA